MAGDELTRGDWWMIGICTLIVLAIDIALFGMRRVTPQQTAPTYSAPASTVDSRN